MGPKHWSKILAAALFIIAASAKSESVEDLERAITVFPNHDEIATGVISIEEAIADGKALFKAKFTRADGQGRPFATGDSKPTPRLDSGPRFSRISGPDATSCWGCHNQPDVGGAGDFATNVFVGAHFLDPPADSISPKITNERHTVSLFGSGAIEIAAFEMTETLRATRDEALNSSELTGKSAEIELVAKGVHFGSLIAYSDGYVDESKVKGVDYDLCVRPFGVKGIAASLREFSIAALNQHHGIEAVERFGWEKTGIDGFGGHDVKNFFSIGQLTALDLFQASLPIPNRSETIDSGDLALVSELGCASCHVPRLTLHTNVFREPNTHNRPGTLRAGIARVNMPIDLPSDSEGYFIHLYSDLRRHNMCDTDIHYLCNEELRQDNVEQNLFMTRPLWNLSNTAPYCHRGDCTTISEAILAHGGEGREARDRYVALSEEQKVRLIRFLRSIGSANSSSSSNVH
jgi:hypothetical protein